MQMTPEARLWLDDMVRRVLARQHVRDPERAGVTYELMSHVHAAAERRAAAAGRTEIVALDLHEAVQEMGGEDELLRAFVRPLAAPAERAGFWLRVGAYVVDAIILGVASWFLASVVMMIVSPIAGVALDPDDFIFPFSTFEMWEETRHASVAFAVFAFLGLVSGAMTLGYFTYFEGKDGRSLGKRVFALRVVRVDGSPVTYREGLIRNLTKLSSWLLFLDVLAWALFFRAEKQRASDRVAETTVVRA